MDTINDIYGVFSYLNNLAFKKILHSCESDELNLIKKQLINEFQCPDMTKVIDVLNLIDSLSVTLLNEEMEEILPKIDTIRENILYLYRYNSFHKKLIGNEVNVCD